MPYNKNGYWSMVADSIGENGRNYTDDDFSLSTLRDEVIQREAQIGRIIAKGGIPRERLTTRLDEIKANIAKRS